MRRVTAILSAAAIVLAAAVVFAQNPNFSGTWVMDAPAGGAAPAGGGGAPGGGGGGGGRGGGRGGGGGWGMEATIAQTATELKVTYMQGQAPLTVTYKLDGTDSTNMMPGRGGAEPAPQVSKATWEAGKLKIVTTTGFGEQTRFVSLVAGKLTIETSTPGRDGGAPTTATTTYSKKP